MRLLLDTCTFLWMVGQEDRLSEVAREALEDGDNSLALHQVSAWEIQIKCLSGKLKLSEPAEEIIREALSSHDLRYQRLDDEAIWHLNKLPEHHKDPFDRVLIASALVGGMKLVTPDPQINRYPVPVIW